MIKQDAGGESIEVESWEIPYEGLGALTASIPAPLGIGKVELEDGSEVPGFIFERYAEQTAMDITRLKSWKNVTDSIMEKDLVSKRNR